jgi:hypothetical protein
MLIREFQDPDTLKLAAIGQFLLKRAQETDAVKPMNVDTFVNIARENGINMTAERFKFLASQQPLNNIISNIQGDQIIWKGSTPPGTASDNKMSVDQARNTVNQMAKRAIDIK